MTSSFESQLDDLLARTQTINSPINAATIGTNIHEYNRPSEVWINDVETFYCQYLKEHPLGNRINSLLQHRNLDTYNKLIACLESIKNDEKFIDDINKKTINDNSKFQMQSNSKYDVFISHANADKENFIDDLDKSLTKLGINIFYDKNSLEWGDKWKEKIIEGTKKSEFAIIVISKNFFGREWTEKELSEFLNQQNKNGQKLILPILHNITTEDLKGKYPSVADIQAIDSSKYSCDEIALLFARQLIKRLKSYE